MPDGTHSCFVRMSDDNAHVIAGNVDDVCKRLGVTVTAIGPLPPAKRTGKGWQMDLLQKRIRAEATQRLDACVERVMKTFGVTHEAALQR
jgi:hypothetical protein